MKSFLILIAFLTLITACAPYVANKEDNNRPNNKPGGNFPNTQLILPEENLQISTGIISIKNTFEVNFGKEINQVSKNYVFTMGDSDAQFVLQDYTLTANASTCRPFDDHFFITDSFEYTNEIYIGQKLLLKKNRTYKLQLIIDNLECTAIKSSFIFRQL